MGVFFFSSRRRHTRSLRDWSSDVCSSDLVTTRVVPLPRLRARHSKNRSLRPVLVRSENKKARDASPVPSSFLIPSSTPLCTACVLLILMGTKTPLSGKHTFREDIFCLQ